MQFPLTVKPVQLKDASPPHDGAPELFQQAPADAIEIVWIRHPSAMQIVQSAPPAAAALTIDPHALGSFGFAPTRQD